MGCPSFIILGKLSHNYGKLPFLMGKSTISMAMFNGYVTNYQRGQWGYRMEYCVKYEWNA
jgi:hypothetical protein